MLFTYKAKDSSGRIVSGELDAADQRAATDRLRAMKLALLAIDEVKEESMLARLNPFRARVKNKEVVIFSRQLSTLVSAGVPLVQGLGILEAQASPLFKPVVAAIKADIESGLGIADAMKKHPQVFSTLYVSMIRAGEVGGILDVILERLSAYLEQAEALKAKIKSSMMYPAVLCSVSVVVTVFLLVFVIPTFKNIFAGFGAELPLPTRIVIGISDGLKANALYILPLPVLLFVAYQKYRATAAGAERIDSLMLKLPVF
ncbi:MAG: type II secretion system F family protein, partial [Elusimicrobia bacterium]|nr:type II secretion system F family protein [Elusimicrobiota bacterium]